MRLVSYRTNGSCKLGALVGEWVVDLSWAYAAFQHRSWLREDVAFEETPMLAVMDAFLESGPAGKTAAEQAINFVHEQLDAERDSLTAGGILIPQTEGTLCPPVQSAGKILCAALNYPGPSGGTPPEYPVLFLKPTSTLTGHEQPIVLPRASQKVTFEGELAVVIGRRGHHILMDAAMDYVAGFTIANDVTARDLENRSSQWTTGKLSDTFTPLGPELVTLDELPDPQNLVITTYWNETVVQRGRTGAMFFDVPFLIHYISEITTLQPGDLILTGSPKTIDTAPAPEIFLKPGDRVSIEIEGLGRLSNHVIAEEEA